MQVVFVLNLSSAVHHEMGCGRYVPLFWQLHFRCWQKCDQIGRNFATLAKFQKSFAIFCTVFSIWQNIKPTLVDFLCFWANLLFLMSKYLVTLAGIYTAKLFKSISGSCLELQCDQIWQNFATLNNVKKLRPFSKGSFSILQFFLMIWKILNVIGQIFIAVNGQNLSK